MSAAQRPDLHFEGLRKPRYFLAYVAEANNTQRLADYLSSERRPLYAASGPEAFAKISILLEQTALERQDRHHHVLGDSALVMEDVAYGDTIQCVEGDAIATGAGGMYEPQLRRLLDHAS